MLNDSNYSSRAKDILLDFLIKAFSQPSLYKGGNEYLWDKDPKTSRIFIADSNVQNMETVEQKTSIIISRGNISWQGNTPDSHLNSDFFSGSKDYKDILSTDMSINCFSREGLEAEFLASLVFQLLRICRPKIRLLYDLHRVDVLGMSGESIVQADSRQELSSVSVFCRLTWTEEWTVSSDFLQMNKIKGEIAIPETGVMEDDPFIAFPIDNILTNPSRLIVTGASTNPSLKAGQSISIVGSSGGHDGSYHIGPVNGDTITLMQPLGGNEDEVGTSAEIIITTPGGTKDGGTIHQTAIEEDLTPPRKRPDITG